MTASGGAPSPFADASDFQDLRPPSNALGAERVGGLVAAPKVKSRKEPQYSEVARLFRFQGTVVLEAVIRKDGSVDILRIRRPLGFGLDENALTAIKQWQFMPGTRNGEPVDVTLNIEVNFNLR